MGGVAAESALEREKATAPAWPSQGLAWYTVFVLLLAYTFSFIDRMILSLLVGPIKRDLAITDTEFSLLGGFAFAIFYTVLGLPLGRLADRTNRRNLVAGGITLWSAMTAVCGLAQNYWTLFFARMGVGVGEATLSPAAYSMLSDSFPKERLGRAVAVYSIGVPLGAGIALILGGFVVKLVGEMPPLELPVLGAIHAWQLTFFVVGLPGLLVALLMFTLREPVRHGRLTGEPSRAPASIPLREAIAFLWRNRSAFAAHFAGLSCLVFVIYGWIAWIPEHFARSYGMARGDAGLYYGAIQALCGAGGLVAGGMLADALLARGKGDGHLRAILISVLLTLPFFIAMPLMPTAELGLAILIPGTFFSAMHGGVAGAALQLVTPNEMRGQIIALYFFVASLIGLGLGPTAVAAITDFVLGDPALLRYSLSIVAAIALPVSAAILVLGLAPFRRSVEAANAGWRSSAA